MTPERRRLGRTALLAAVTIAIVAIAERVGVLEPLERHLYDRRVRGYQRFMPEPTDRLVHVDIDDAAIDEIGRLPWSRWKLAVVTDVLREAGAGQIGLDLLLSEREGEASVGGPDAVLAGSIERAANVVMPLSLAIHERRPPLFDRMVRLLEQDPAMSRPDCLAAVAASDEGGADIEASRLFHPALREGLRRRIERELGRGAAGPDDLRKRLLPALSAIVTHSARLTEIARQYERALSMRRLRELGRPWAPSADGVAVAADAIVPIPPLADAAAATGFVDFLPDADSVLRSVPLWVAFDGDLYPQMGLALACQALGVSMSDVRVEPGRVVIPGGADEGADRVLPVGRRRAGPRGEVVGCLFDVPWRGPVNAWWRMYERPGSEHATHVPVTSLWSIHESAERVATNLATLDDALLWALSRLDPPRFKALQADPPPAADLAARETLSRICLEQMATLGFLQVEQFDPADLEAEERELLLTIGHLRLLPAELRRQAADLEARRAALRGRVQGRAVIVGLVATGAIVDVVPTPLHMRCPGAVVHGAIFDAVMTGESWRRAPRWVGPALVVLLGLLGTVAVGSLAPLGATVMALVLGIAWWLLNAVLLFDRANLIVPAAGPLVVVALVWAVGTLHRFVAERIERARITGRFRSYVDPALVEFVVEHPEQARFDGAVRELTVVFTDLAGFTTLSESLRERTVPLLNEYMGRMVPVIRQRGGYVNKFLGDGIMFFFGAPRANAEHARDALLTALDMQTELADFNRWLAGRELPSVKMRVGISSGNMVVGDAGSSDASDYTVIGDAVNLSARLESANKATGTWILINDRAAMLAWDQFLLRPIGRLQVVGKRQGVMTYEPLVPLACADDAQRRLVELTDAMVSAYIRGRFQACTAAAGHLEAACGPSPLTQLYRRVSAAMDGAPPGPDFVGQIVLEEK